MSMGENSQKGAESRGAPQTMPADRLSGRFADQGASKPCQSPPKITVPPIGQDCPGRSGITPQRDRLKPPMGQSNTPVRSGKTP